MEMKESVRKMVAKAEVPAEMTAALEAMGNEEFRAEAERVEESIDKEDFTEQKRLYVIAVIREQMRRCALNAERTKAIEAELEEKQKLFAELQRVHDDLQLYVEELRRSVKRPGRNDPCPCGSGKKYKYCCGKF